ncbi:MAG: chemotaxis protein CheW, partial [Spongiibacteraceae bacterium]
PAPELSAPIADAVEPARPNTSVSANVMPLATARAARPTRMVEPLQTFAEPRPFAEPVRALRMPLPPIAEAPPVFEVEVTPAPVVRAPVQPAPVKPPPVITPAVIEPAPVVEDEIDSTTEVATPTPPVWAANGRPQWAQQPFECLLFKSGGLTLAVPLVELGSIYPLEEGDITGIFGQIDWFLGLMRTKYGNVRVVDTARVVMPERYRDEMAAAYHFVLTLDGSDWGLGIDAIAGTTLLDPEAVRWRGDRSKRPWLAGTVVEKMCALLDVAQLRYMFNQLDRKRGERPR